MMKKALDGITILDFSQLLAGPFCSMMLGDLGANVIKVERVGKGDIYRDMTFFNEYLGEKESPLFMAWNRNKRSLAIDLKDPQAREIIFEMAKTADVVIENFRPGVMARLGYGYEDFKAVNPKIVYASNSGFGSSGPYVKRPGQDMLVQAITGLTTLTGRKESPPTPLGTGLPDMLSSFHMVYGILAALLHAEKSGVGQHVEVSLMHSTMALESQEFTTILNVKKELDYTRPESGIGHPFQAAPFGIYACSDGYVAIAMGPFEVLVDALEAPHLMEYMDPQVRFDKRDEVFAAIEAVMKTNTCDYWLNRMWERDLWVSNIQDITDIENDPQVQHMGYLTEYEHKNAGKVRCVSPAVQMSETPAEIILPPPMIGEHTREILAEYGVSEETISSLFEKNAVSEEK